MKGTVAGSRLWSGSRESKRKTVGDYGAVVGPGDSTGDLRGGVVRESESFTETRGGFKGSRCRSGFSLGVFDRCTWGDEARGS